MPEKKVKELLRKYLEGRTTPEEEKLIDEWYESLSEKNLPLLSDGEKSELRDAYWGGLQSGMRTSATKRRRLWPTFAAIAASISLIIALAFYVLPPEATKRVAQVMNPPDAEIIENNSGESKEILLPDGSTVTLASNSVLQYQEDFNRTDRKIQLSGEAFFNIAHNAEKPFYAFANEVVTKVLGTSFNIVAYPDDLNVTVSVKTGKVSVYTRSDEKGRLADQEEDLILTPNQQAVYSRNEQKVSRTLVKEPLPVIAEEKMGRVRFEEAPVSEVFEALERMYNIEIRFDEAIFSRCSITTSVSGRDMFERIDVICEIIGASYRVDDTAIVISGTGCN